MDCHCQVVLRSDDGERCFGPGPAQLLEEVERLGSLQQAAKAMYLSYTKALRMLQRAEAAFGCPLLVRTAGGSQGGGSALTTEGRQLLARYRALETAVRVEAAEQYAAIFSAPDRASDGHSCGLSPKGL